MMKIIISPAKKMVENNDFLLSSSVPMFMMETACLLNQLKTLDYTQLKELLCCNDQIASLNYDRFKDMDLCHQLTPALLSYEGIQYQYMRPQVFTNEQWEYVNEHLYILSGFYGMLKPMDGITPYRLEMQAKLTINEQKGLYNFWNRKIYDAITKDASVILNLASKEYSKVIEKYLKENDTFVTCVFGELVNGKIKVKATEAKMARGEMVSYLAKNNILDLDGVKSFNEMGFSYCPERSTRKEFVFLK